MHSSKNCSVLLHTPKSLFDLYGKAVRGELPSPLLPLRHAASGLLVSTIPSSGIFCTVVLLPVSPIYHGTCKHYALAKILTYLFYHTPNTTEIPQMTRS